jgi:hypothetical protein
VTSKIVDLHQTNIDIRGSGDNQLLLTTRVLKEHLHFLRATKLAHTLFIDWRKCFPRFRCSLQKRNHTVALCTVSELLTHLGYSDLFVRLNVEFSFCLVEETANSVLRFIKMSRSITEQWDGPSNFKTSSYVVQYWRLLEWRPLTQSFRPHYGSGVDTTSNTNE